MCTQSPHTIPCKDKANPNISEQHPSVSQKCTECQEIKILYPRVDE